MSADITLDKFKLPASIARPEDIGKVIHEVYLVDNHLSQEAIRHPDKTIMVKASLKLDDLLKSNGLDITISQNRLQLQQWLDIVKLRAPVINISFASEASDGFIEKLVSWFRKEVNPYLLLTVGLDPSIGIGSRVRTTNKVFDFSLKNRLRDSQQLLIAAIDKPGG